MNTVNEFKQNENWCLSQNTDNNGLFQTKFPDKSFKDKTTAVKTKNIFENIYGSKIIWSFSTGDFILNFVAKSLKQTN